MIKVSKKERDSFLKSRKIVKKVAPKKEIKEMAKEISPKVSSLGQGAKWVNWRVRVAGCTKATAAIYTHPSRPKINKEKDNAQHSSK